MAQDLSIRGDAELGADYGPPDAAVPRLARKVQSQSSGAFAQAVALVDWHARRAEERHERLRQSGTAGQHEAHATSEGALQLLGGPTLEGGVQFLEDTRYGAEEAHTELTAVRQQV